MVNFNNFKDPIYLTFDKTSLKFGHKSINVYRREFRVYSNYHLNGFGFRLLDDTGMIIKNLDYYEYQGGQHWYGEGEHHFVFDMKFIRNHAHLTYDNPQIIVLMTSSIKYSTTLTFSSVIDYLTLSQWWFSSSNKPKNQQVKFNLNLNNKASSLLFTKLY